MTEPYSFSDQVAAPLPALHQDATPYAQQVHAGPATALAMPEPAPSAPEIPSSFRFNNQVKAWLAARPGTPRDFGFHPSEMKEMCPVLHYFVDEARSNLASPDGRVVEQAFGFLRAWLDARAKEFNPGVQMELREGDYIHDDVRYYLGMIGVLVGRWSCSFCGAKTTDERGQMPRMEVPDMQGRPIYDAAPCPACFGRNRRNDIAWCYVEPYLKNAEWNIDGHVDGILRVPFEGAPGGYVECILEIKSINEAGFQMKYGVIPKPEHIQQASLYAWFLGVAFVYFVYVNKNQVQHWKEFAVRRDETAILDAQGKMIAVLDAKRTGIPPIHVRACRDIREPRAAACPAVERCFGCKPPENFLKM